VRPHVVCNTKFIGKQSWYKYDISLVSEFFISKDVFKLDAIEICYFYT